MLRQKKTSKRDSLAANREALYFILTANQTAFRMLGKQAFGGNRSAFPFDCPIVTEHAFGLLFVTQFPLFSATMIATTKKYFNRRNCRTTAHLCLKVFCVHSVLQFKHNYSQILSYFIFPQCRCDGLIIIKKITCTHTQTQPAKSSHIPYPIKSKSTSTLATI